MSNQKLEAFLSWGSSAWHEVRFSVQNPTPEFAGSLNISFIPKDKLMKIEIDGFFATTVCGQPGFCAGDEILGSLRVQVSAVPVCGTLVKPPRLGL